MNFLFTIIFAVVINECFAASDVGSSSGRFKFNIDSLKYDGEPVTFACVSDES